MENYVHPNTTHGQRYTVEYQTWRNIIKRCYNPKNISYKYYGYRGIKVCDRWRYSFENFFADMGKKPSKLHSIDRENTNGDYEPLNCKWATKKEQANNRTTSYLYTAGELTLNKEEWAKRWGVTKRAITRYQEAGKSFEQIFQYFEFQESKKHVKHFYNGEEMWLSDIAKLLGINYVNFRKYYKRTKNLEKSIENFKLTNHGIQI